MPFTEHCENPQCPNSRKDILGYSASREAVEKESVCPLCKQKTQIKPADSSPSGRSHKHKGTL